MNQEIKDKLHYYLPYKQKIYVEKLDAILQITSLHELGEYPVWTSLVWDNNRLSYSPEQNGPVAPAIGHGWKYHEIKPFFRPLSSLTKSIKIEGYNNGNPFVPMFHLICLALDIDIRTANNFTQSNIYATNEVIIRLGYAQYHLIYERDNSFTLFQYDITEDLSVDEMGMQMDESWFKNQRLIRVKNYHALFDLLYQWHFWLWNQELFTTGEILQIED